MNTLQESPTKLEKFSYHDRIINHDGAKKFLNLFNERGEFWEQYNDEIFDLLNHNFLVFDELFYNATKSPSILNGASNDFGLNTHYAYISVRVTDDLLKIFTGNYIKKKFNSQDGVFTIQDPEAIPLFVQELSTFEKQDYTKLRGERVTNRPISHDGAGIGLIDTVRHLKSQGGNLSARIEGIPDNNQLNKLFMTAVVPRKKESEQTPQDISSSYIAHLS